MTFARGNFIEIGRLNIVGGEEKTRQMVRIDNMMVHNMTGNHRLFVIVSNVRVTNDRDALLDLPILELSSTTQIVGLPAILPGKLYVVDEIDNDKMVWVNWTLQFL